MLRATGRRWRCECQEKQSGVHIFLAKPRGVTCEPSEAQDSQLCICSAFNNERIACRVVDQPMRRTRASAHGRAAESCRRSVRPSDRVCCCFTSTYEGLAIHTYRQAAVPNIAGATETLIRPSRPPVGICACPTHWLVEHPASDLFPASREGQNVSRTTG